MIAEIHLIIIAGESMNASTILWTYKLRSSAGIDTPVDITGYTARAKIRSNFSSAGATILDMSNGNGKLVLGGAFGTIAPVLSSSETQGLWVDGLKPSRVIDGRLSYELGFWDLELIAPNGNVKRLMQGPAMIVPEASRP